MKLLGLVSVATAIALSGCMASPSPEQAGTLVESRLRVASQDPSDRIMVGAEGFERPVDVQRVSATRAVVIPISGKLRYVDVEDAARQATGCAARATPEIYAATNNNPTRLMADSVLRSFDYRLPVDLSC